MDTYPRHSLATWRRLGRIAFYSGPERGCLPPPDDPEARDAWCDGFRRAWRHYYSRLPTTDLDDALLEFELHRTLEGHHKAEDDGDRIAAVDRPSRHLH
ncbi:MAG: hypothetical protein VBE63_10020 [Lamprobacter sp.]|uniref:hypothetical protein n=1 Tax=Lamprobacter sp. TaxID=3100796 RepID=UPI002B257C50|nr:hypothetical protein [Lamprobacter sp.]MEA3640267.1 hypothetical protein [Lamprobacter sp.]